MSDQSGTAISLAPPPEECNLFDKEGWGRKTVKKKRKKSKPEYASDDVRAHAAKLVEMLHRHDASSFNHPQLYRALGVGYDVPSRLRSKNTQISKALIIQLAELFGLRAEIFFELKSLSSDEALKAIEHFEKHHCTFVTPHYWDR